MIDWRDAKPELVKLAKQRQLIIVVGSGISVASKLPTWEGFLDKFINFCQDLAKTYRAVNIEDVFQGDLFRDAVLQKRKSPAHVATVLKTKINELPQNIRTNVEIDFRRWFYGLFAKASPNENHKLITSTNYPFILTSNYDLLLEESAKSIGSPYSSLSFYEKEAIAESVYSRTPAIIHVHGTCADVVLDKIVLTSEDYIRIVKRGVPGFTFAIQSLFLNFSALFVGYGASDPHLEDLVEEFSSYFDFPQSQNMARNYLVVMKKRAGRILTDYKKRMRTELIQVDDVSDYRELLNELKLASPRQIAISY